jgi:phosphoserine phosphatase
LDTCDVVIETDPMPAMLSNALVLTAPPGSGALDPAAVGLARGELARSAILAEQWLGDAEAWEALFVPEPDTADRGQLRARVAAALAPRPVDVNVVLGDVACRRKQLLVADMESTIIEQECLDEMADVLGLGSRISDITARAMRGELDFAAALKERVGLLRGADAAVLERVYERVTLMPGATTLIATMRASGATCALVSGGFTFFTDRVANRLGFDVRQANTLELAGGRIAGTVADPILGREAKLAALERLARERGLGAALTMAVGDGANDLAMIKAAGLGVAFRAKPMVTAEAPASVTHGDLTALLYLQGYARAEFTAAP